MSTVRDVFLIKTFFGGKIEKEEMLAQLRHHRALHQEQLAVYQGPVRETLQQSIEATGMERDGLFWNLTLDMGIEYEQGWIKWCEEAIEKIEAMDDDWMNA